MELTESEAPAVSAALENMSNSLLSADPASLSADAADAAAGNARDRSRTYKRGAVALVFLVPALGGFLFGYDISVTSYAILQLSSTYIENQAALQGLVVSAASLGAFLGSLFIFNIADAIGRKRELQSGAILYFLGAALEVLSASLFKTQGVGVATLVGSRIVYGLGIACAMHGGPTYIAEMSPPEIRGLLVSLKEAVIVLGILAGYVVGYLFSTAHNGWQYSYGCSLVVSSIMLALTFTIPRSCRWLLLKGSEDEALASVRFVFTEQSAMQEFEAMKAQTVTTSEPVSGDIATAGPSPAISDSSSNIKSIWSAEYRAPMIAGIGLVILQQITGQPSILSYATPIFKNAGLSDYASILVALFKLLATVSAAATVERYGRKTLLYVGNTFMLLALLVLVACFGSSGSETFVLISMFAYIAGYQYSFGPISWLMISEVFPLKARGQAVAVAVQMNFLFNAIVQFAVPVLTRLVGLNVTFFMFALLTVYSIYFVRTKVPETKGLTLEEIEQQFRDSRRVRDEATSAAETETLLETETSLIP